VCVCVQQNILNAKYKEDKIFVTKWKLCEKKNHFGATNQRNSTIQKQSSLQDIRTHIPLCSSRTFNSDMKPIVNASQPNLLLEGVFDGFLYLKTDP
jgi:hypothetical protein